MFVVKSLSLVTVLMFCDAHILLRLINAVLASVILYLTPLSVPLDLSTTWPKYVKYSASSLGTSQVTMGLLLMLLLFIIFVSCLLIFSLNLAELDCSMLSC